MWLFEKCINIISRPVKLKKQKWQNTTTSTTTNTKKKRFEPVWLSGHHGLVTFFLKMALSYTKRFLTSGLESRLT